ncbi:DUF6364 family protein [Algoriphagus sp.]|uniref:DUF6364 family protein n=1 Tax=Algoriphagus sp. TaxID=1872435 RepID=UPI00391A6F51
MKKKLTLSLDKAGIEKAETYSRVNEKPISERISRIAGKIEIPVDFNLNEELRKNLEEKYLKCP